MSNSKGLTLELCRDCAPSVVPGIDPATWVYYEPDNPDTGCWHCGVTGSELAPMRVQVRTVEPGVYEIESQPNVYVLAAFGGPNGDDDDDE